jgi:hypothetical protein
MPIRDTIPPPLARRKRRPVAAGTFADQALYGAPPATQLNKSNTYNSILYKSNI